VEKHLMLIGGERVAAASGQWLESFNPYTGTPWALIPRGAAVDVERAVTAAHKAFRGREWRGLTATARGKILHKLADLISARADELAAMRMDGRHRTRAEDGAHARSRHRVGQHVPSVEPTVAVRRLQALGLRARERPVVDPRVRAGEERLDRDERRRRAEPLYHSIIIR
jgi:hypothetical protein